MVTAEGNGKADAPLGPVGKRMAALLESAFQPDWLRLVDESALHAGHAGARQDGETHFRLAIVSAAFAGLSRVARQRAVHAVLADALAGPVHALSVQALAPGEAGAAPGA